MQKLGLRERLRETEMIEAWSKIVGAFNAGSSTRRCALRPRTPAGFTLRARTGFKDRHLAKVKETLRRKSHPRHPLPGWLSCCHSESGLPSR